MSNSYVDIKYTDMRLTPCGCKNQPFFIENNAEWIERTSMLDISGLIVATPTPFNDDGKIDFDYVVRHLDFLRERGVDGVVPSGTNGEGASMSLNERKDLASIVAKNKGNLKVVAGTGCASLPDTIELTKAAQQAGADAALVVPPFFFKTNYPDGLYNYYVAVLSATDLPIFLYNIPQFSAVEITDELVGRLSEFPNLAGVKDSAGNPDRTRRYIDRFSNLAIFYGADRVIEAMAGSGARGNVSGLANAFPELISSAMNFREKRQGSAMQAKVNALADIFDKYPLFAANKYALELRGFPSVHVRPPLLDLTNEQKMQLEKELNAIELI